MLDRRPPAVEGIQSSPPRAAGCRLSRESLRQAAPLRGVWIGTSGWHYASWFRHKSWYEPKILDVLRDRNVALCISDHHDAPAPWEVTASHVYIRGHGPGGHYRDNYSDQALRDWARFIGRCRRQGRQMF